MEVDLPFKQDVVSSSLTGSTRFMTDISLLHWFNGTRPDDYAHWAQCIKCEGKVTVVVQFHQLQGGGTGMTVMPICQNCGEEYHPADVLPK